MSKTKGIKRRNVEQPETVDSVAKKQRKDPSSWSNDDMYDWLEENKLSSVRNSFEEQEIHPQDLLTLTSNDLEEVGIKKMGLRKRFLNAVKELKKETEDEENREEEEDDKASKHVDTPLRSLRESYKLQMSSHLDLDGVDEGSIVYDYIKNGETADCCTRMCGIECLSFIIAMFLELILPGQGGGSLLTVCLVIFDARMLGGYILGYKFIDLANRGRKPSPGKMLGYVLGKFLLSMFCCNFGTCPCCCGGNGHQSWLDQRLDLLVVSDKADVALGRELSEFAAVIATGNLE
eukprot:CAMPEP_0184495908 /NCGR_PEP_ID=MMETSP0113_2-20130426/32665_1 /TAXON_ID=91329 /ORGANISM="Norrisiella sphaerica, Strain BC52" /LENGTH=290 /DNA_ID=CAMNT_0026882325 /DNA_START=143 /DNA_END=1013 /DNA_ORIENTATION=+